MGALSEAKPSIEGAVAKIANALQIAEKACYAVAMTGNSVLAAGENVSALARRVIDLVMAEGERDTVTLFTGVGMTETDIAEIADYVGTSYLYTETDLVETGVKAFELLLSFE